MGTPTSPDTAGCMPVATPTTLTASFASGSLASTADCRFGASSCTVAVPACATGEWLCDSGFGSGSGSGSGSASASGSGSGSGPASGCGCGCGGGSACGSGSDSGGACGSSSTRADDAPSACITDPPTRCAATSSAPRSSRSDSGSLMRATRKPSCMLPASPPPTPAPGASWPLSTASITRSSGVSARATRVVPSRVLIWTMPSWSVRITSPWRIASPTFSGRSVPSGCLIMATPQRAVTVPMAVFARVGMAWPVLYVLKRSEDIGGVRRWRSAAGADREGRHRTIVFLIDRPPP